MFKSKSLIRIFIILIVLGLILYFKPINKFSNDSKGKPDPGKMPPTAVTVFVCKAGVLINSIESSGSLIAFQEVDIVSEISGKITDIPFVEGSKVAKNDLILKIYDKDLQVQLRKLNLQKELIEKNNNRQKQLLNISAISQQEYDAIQNQLSTLEADIEAVKNQIEKTEIRAPFSGIMGLKDAYEGSYVSPNTHIARLQEIEQLKVDFSIPEKYITGVSKGMEIEFFQEGVKDTLRANIYAIDPMIDANSRTIHLRAKFNNTAGKYFPGSFVKIKLRLKEIPDAIMIPTEALIPQLKGQKVFIIRQGKAYPQNVETGIRTDSKVQISKGLQSGDTLITTGIMQIKPKAKVKILNFQ